MHKTITSIQNADIKGIISLQEKSRERKKVGLFVVEGIREILLAAASDYHFEKIFYLEEKINPSDFPVVFEKTTQIVGISREVYEKIAYRETTEGIVAVLSMKKHAVDSLTFLSTNPLVLVVESPEKPGNIGAILRTADAAGIDAVIISDSNTDLYNPNVIRSSVGTIFTNRIAVGTNEEVISFLKANKFQILTAVLDEKASNYLSKNYQQSTAIVVGTEATGLSEQWKSVSDSNIIIPMRGKIDSMNVSVAAAILIFEAVRQRAKE